MPSASATMAAYSFGSVTSESCFRPCAVRSAFTSALNVGFFDEYELMNAYYSIVYTTHSHMPEAPRARILMPLTRDITPEEYNAIARYLADEIGMAMIDPCSFKINQLMYWANCPSDGEYICRAYEGDWLDPDAYLAAHPNWKDCASLPIAPAERETMERDRKKQEEEKKQQRAEQR